MKILGHPVHIMLVHFPTALLPMDLVCSLANYFTKKPSFIDASFYAMSGGILIGWLAVVFGTFDLLNVVNNKPLAIKIAAIHGSLNASVLMVYTVLAYSQFKNYPELIPDGISILIIKAISILFLIIGNFLGGSLILKYKVAVEND